MPFLAELHIPHQDIHKLIHKPLSRFFLKSGSMEGGGGGGSSFLAPPFLYTTMVWGTWKEKKKKPMQSIQDLQSTLTLAISFRGRGGGAIASFHTPPSTWWNPMGCTLCDSRVVVALEMLRIVDLYEGASTTWNEADNRALINLVLQVYLSTSAEQWAMQVV